MINDKKVLAVVTARGDSKGLPGKNYRPLLGKPLFIWSVNAALKSDLVDHVFISSNCAYIESISNDIDNDRVTFVKRPEEISGPHSKNEEAIIHSVEHYEDKFGHSPDYVVNLQPTSPLRLRSAIDTMLESMDECGKKSALTVGEHSPFFMRNGEDKVHWMYDIFNRPMRQDLKDSEMFLHDDGNVYIMSVPHLFETMCRLDLDPYIYINDKYCSLQIDNLLDFNIMECIMTQVRSGNKYV